jgi:hypothetical protein
MKSVIEALEPVMHTIHPCVGTLKVREVYTEQLNKGKRVVRNKHEIKLRTCEAKEENTRLDGKKRY